MKPNDKPCMDVWIDVKNFELKDMVVGKKYKLKLRDGGIHEHICNIMYDDYVNFGYRNWNFYFNGKYKGQDLPSMDIVSFCEIVEIDYKKEYNELQTKVAMLEKALRFYADESEWYNSGSPWKLIFNSKNYDGHGFEIAKNALNASPKYPRTME